MMKIEIPPNSKTDRYGRWERSILTLKIIAIRLLREFQMFIYLALNKALKALIREDMKSTPTSGSYQTPFFDLQSP